MDVYSGIRIDFSWPACPCDLTVDVRDRTMPWEPCSVPRRQEIKCGLPPAVPWFFFALEKAGGPRIG